MASTSSPRTLVIEKPFGFTIFLAGIILVLTWGIAEALLRLSVQYSLLPTPRIGSVNAELDTKLIQLDKFLNENGSIDCIFLGSSQLDEAVNPAVFEKTYQDLTGNHLRCFNFSLGTLTASPAGKIARLLAIRYHPKILFIGISARDFSKDFGELTRPLLDDPWVRYALGDFTLSGWLTENSYTYRELLTIRSSLNPDYMALHDRLSYQLTAQGYLTVTGNDLSNPKKNFIPKFKLSKEDLAGLDEIAELNSDHLQVIFLEVPVHYSFIPFYIQADPLAYQTLFIEPITTYFFQKNLPFWQNQELMQEIVPDSGWNDVKHFNKSGAEIFSSWLAHETDKAAKAGAIRIPGND